MYRHNEISITPLVTMTRAQNSAEAWNSNASNRFALSSFGFVFNLYEGTGRTTSVNFGFGYNRLADLNYRSSFRSTGNMGSIADMYALQLGQAKSRPTTSRATTSTGSTRVPSSGPQFWATRRAWSTI